MFSFLVFATNFNALVGLVFDQRKMYHGGGGQVLKAYKVDFCMLFARSVNVRVNNICNICSQ